jgi:hypothetical protein
VVRRVLNDDLLVAREDQLPALPTLDHADALADVMPSVRGSAR